MTQTRSTQIVITLLRLSLAWVFLYAASNQVFGGGFSVTGFLAHTTTFNWLFAPFTGPVMAPITSFLVAWGHLLIGLSLLLGLMVRASALAGVVLMILYWMAHLDFPYVDSPVNFLLDFHIVYVLVLALLIDVRAGHIWGLDSWAVQQPWVQNSRLLAWAASAR